MSDDPPTPRPLLIPQSRGVTGISYPEWDWRVAAYHPTHAVVRESIAGAGDANWAESILRKRAREIREVRRQFERLRSQRVWHGRQLDGFFESKRSTNGTTRPLVVELPASNMIVTLGWELLSGTSRLP